MYINGNLGAALDDYIVGIDESNIANQLRTQVMNHFNNPNNYKLSADSPAHGESYGVSNIDGGGWKFYPVDSAPSQAGPQSLKADISGEYGNYYRVPNNSVQQWINKSNFDRLTQAEINRRVGLLVDQEVLAYLKGKQLSTIAANLQSAIDGVVDSVKAAINASGSWYQYWGLSV